MPPDPPIPAHPAPMDIPWDLIHPPPPPWWRPVRLAITALNLGAPSAFICSVLVIALNRKCISPSEGLAALCTASLQLTVTAAISLLILIAVRRCLGPPVSTFVRVHLTVLALTFLLALLGGMLSPNLFAHPEHS